MSDPGYRPDPNHPIIAALRQMDDTVDIAPTFEEALATVGLDLDVLIYAAEQRALRATLLMSGRRDEFAEPADGQMKPRPIATTPQERARMNGLIPIYLEAMALGWVAYRRTLAELHEPIREALEGDSNDADHDALVEVAETLGVEYEVSD